VSRPLVTSLPLALQPEILSSPVRARAMIRPVTSGVRHPLFARVFDRVSPLMERESGPLRDELLAGLHGTVVEIGAGNGVNFAHYPATVREVIALEPEPYLRHRAIEVARSASVSVRVGSARAEHLPFDDDSIDAAVVSLVLCSVADLAAAVAEIRRVLKPGGELRFFEHVRSENPRKARLQRTLDRPRLWPRLGGGCHCGRESVAALRDAGLDIERIRSVDIGPSWIHTNPHVIGRARPRGR
jgi:ubiquinone/menaquinone biosynthesis C-methylase UbiE